MFRPSAARRAPPSPAFRESHRSAPSTSSVTLTPPRFDWTDRETLEAVEGRDLEGR